MRTVELKIHDIAFGGKGVGRDNGKAVFVPFTIEGESVLAKITREKKQFAEGEPVDVREASPDRVNPPCPYFGRCGGCAYQHIEYGHQLEVKVRQVQDVLRRIGKLKDPPMRPIVPSSQHYGYRNRVTVHAENGVVGYYQRESHQLIDVERCPIAMEEVNRELTDLRAHEVPDGHYTLRAKTRSEGAVRHFTQTNDDVGEALRRLIVQSVAPNQDLLVDAFCGAGFFAKALLEKFQRVIGIDWDRFAIATARENATKKESYIAGDVAAELYAALEKCDLDKTWLIVDPPATGLSPAIRKVIVDFAPANALYVSCDPPTLARDLADLEWRFQIESVTPLDMFPQTSEIEVLVQLRRLG